MAVNPNNEDWRKAIRSAGYEGDSYGSPTEYDPGMLTQQVPEGSGMPTYGVGSPSGYRKFNYTSGSKRTLPSKKGFKVKK